MKCVNCGEQLPDNAKFCGSCGSKIEKKAKRKKTPLWLRLAVIGAAAIIGTLLGKCMVAPAIAPDAAEETVANVVVRETVALPQAEVVSGSFVVHASVPDSWYNAGIWAWSDVKGNLFEEWPGYAMKLEEDGWYSFELPDWINYIIISGNDGTVQTEDIFIEGRELWLVVNEDLTYGMSYGTATVENSGVGTYQGGADDYTSFFTERNIVDSSRVSFMLDSFAGVMMLDDYIMKQEIGYKDDIVKEIVWTYYYELSALTEAEKQTAEADMQKFFEELGFGALDFTSVECDVGYQYCRVTIMLKELDNTANLRALANVETVGEAFVGVDYISASKTIAEMPEGGFICKE